jgi:ribosomal-protein-serine acetyltransferase
MEPLQVTDDAFLRPWEEADAAELSAAVAANREHLAPWLPWAESHGFEDAVEFIARSRAQAAADEGVQFGLWVDGKIVGGVGFHGVDRLNRSTSIGYWLAAEAQGRGLMTAAVRALLGQAFGAWDLHRVVIEAVPANTRSRAIPERLGFTEEAVLREAKLLRGRYEDAVLYAMLAPDWPSAPAREATGSE